MNLSERRIVFDRAEKYRDAVVDERLGNPGHHRESETAVGIVGQKTDGETPIAEQALGQGIRPEPDLGRDTLDPFPRIAAHSPGIVQRFRCGRNADTGGSGNIVNRYPTVSDPLVFQMSSPKLICAEKTFSQSESQDEKSFSQFF
ncbi:hypothetical protein GGD50_002935 [Rhizobium paranaense]|uniref:Uncharacterized protein n=1 Tax=Rhizobium paranaense TaxID=1650438 RepID=A0A7W9D1L0_9HYPH|nr:hypothetical protein [Rhizobium paranaense]